MVWLAIEICKISPLDTNKILIRGKFLSNHVFDILEYFCQNNEYEIGTLLQSGEIKEWAQGLKLPAHVLHKWLQVSASVLKETLITCSQRAEIAENQAQNLILQVIELQCKLNFRPHRVSAESEGIDWEGMVSWKLEWGHMGRSWWSWGHWTLPFWWVCFASRSSCSIPIWG